MPHPRSRRLLHVLILLTLVGIALLLLPLRAQLPGLPAMKAADVSVSGLSSGGYMAVQYGVAYSASVKGAGVIAGGPYSCSRGSVDTATSVCSCTGLGLCRVQPGGTGVAGLAALTAQYAAERSIDPVANLAAQRIWMFSGTADSVVPQAVMNDLYSYYRRYMDSGNIRYRKDVAAEHAMPTDSAGNPCSTLGPPYISNCGIDAAGQLLQWIYPGLAPRSGSAPAGRLLEFDQAQYLADPTAHGMAASGFLYIPQACDVDGGSNGQGCKLHVAFHGCKQDARSIGDRFIHDTGYLRWADSNRILVLFPQAAPIFPLANPNACWDWFNYDDPHFARKNGRQMAAVKAMVDRLSGTAPTPPPPGGALCFTATNPDHVLAGRAYKRYFFAYAQGSGQSMGLNSLFIRTTLRRTAPGHFVVGSCP
ncbi:PHA-depolymerase-like protein [Massilia sp. Root418]|uniref:extracellular catalytic domain type 2 short-chain-length polyhydroxyalkanoate depolymerase n=1 Tax=Massilia sp. Root418 TaxID=1736532 RepID=UPI000A8DD62F|nr:PHA-depolymerase-like protein [Massilia sp. Root418]